ncbi:MAG: redoxin domain-containing protein [Treponema sp.]|jgi:peroxiredoxin|nr:redoxin domain-containing protein [Treponema sp.]
MLKNKSKIIIITVVLAVVIAGAIISYNRLGKHLENSDSINTDKSNNRIKAPDFSMINSEGKTIKLSDMKGKPIVLNFWASWCPPCRIEMPDFDRVWKELGDDTHFMMVCLVDGIQETVKKGSDYISGQGFSFPVYFDTRQEGAQAYGIRSIPTTFFIDSEGFIVSRAQGAINESALRSRIELIR